MLFKVNNREDELLLEVDKKFENIFFKEDIIKESENLPNKIKIFLEKGKSIEKEYYTNDNNKLFLLINYFIFIENKIKEINKINGIIQKNNKSNNK